jgi:hypothetical protein
VALLEKYQVQPSHPILSAMIQAGVAGSPSTPPPPTP